MNLLLATVVFIIGFCANFLLMIILIGIHQDLDRAAGIQWDAVEVTAAVGVLCNVLVGWYALMGAEHLDGRGPL